MDIADFFICLQQILCKTILNYAEKGYLPRAIFLENFRIFQNKKESKFLCK